MPKSLILYWTFTPHNEPMRADKFLRHQTRKKKETPRYRTGGLGFREPTITRLIKQDGRLLLLKPETTTIHLAVEGGLNADLEPVYSLGFYTPQYQAFYNELTSLICSFPEIVVNCNDFKNTPIEKWLKETFNK